MPNARFEPIGLNRARLSELMRERKLDGILLSSPENVFYTTGYPDLPSSGNPIIYALRNRLPFFSFVDGEGKITLLAWMGASAGVEYGVDDTRFFFTAPMATNQLTTLLKAKLPANAALGVETTCPYAVIQLAQEAVHPASIAFVDDIMDRLRLIKSQAEIERIRRSTQIVDETVMELAHNLRLGMSRLELIQEAKWRMIKNGAHGVDHVTVAFGSANPEVALGETLEENQIVTLDLGAVYDGYVSDNRRLVYTGEVPEDLKALHKRLCRIVADLGKALRPGKTFADMHRYGKELYAQQGLAPMFLSVGHSMGLQVEEAWLLSNDQTVIEEGMVINVELYSMCDQRIAIGDEETYVIGTEGTEQLSKLPVEIISLQ